MPDNVNATLNLPHPLFIDLLTEQINFKEMLASSDFSIDGSQTDLLKFFGLFEKPDPSFAIVLPQ